MGLVRNARLDGTIDDGLWVRMEQLDPDQGNYVFAAIVNESTDQMLCWDRSEGRLYLSAPVPAVQVLTTRNSGSFNKSVEEAANQDANDKACYVIRWSDYAVPAGATIDVRYGSISTYSEATTSFCYGWGGGLSGGGSRGIQTTGISAATDGQAGDSFKWYIGDDLRVQKGVGYYMWVLLRDLNGGLLDIARSNGMLTVIS